ncbi:NosL family protein [Natronomonas pharaonis DSM 2160]|uniref:NosL family protein n=1 Tax=Natronomonas pharaonis (strain ATCC 35678 / DSM 2160 / CIP 103997 / JCM 8858 / NBRC 14720 / NCIMB 2260 / Gabara) TaxID=348780 RepID=A0A1U7EVZ1_NATPD|nr:nitrous oxide reductase accessory protein NosL [Natronomonas pharaonis]CAI49235.1 NosL family protein [Natronomonas pharaonis DSM 2160]
MQQRLSDSRRRRTVLAAIGAGAAGLAGCLDGGSSNDPEDDASPEVSDQSFPDHPVTEPRDPPEGRRCDGPCGMVAAEYPDWNAQVAHADGQGAFFDTPGCLVAYYQHHTFYDGPPAEIEGVWVRDFETTELLDAAEAYFVLDTDDGRHAEPMGSNPKPFADRDDAVSYVESYQDLTTDDIVGLDEFGPEEAHVYRDYPLDEA